jgi:hypothetical protein
MWFSLAAKNPDLRDVAVRARETLDATMTPAAIARAEDLAKTWTPKIGGR